MTPRAREAFWQGCASSATSRARTSSIEYRWAEGRSSASRELAAELVRLKVDVIVAATAAASRAAKQATTHDSHRHGDQSAIRSAAGFVASLARPGRKRHRAVAIDAPRSRRQAAGAAQGGGPAVVARGCALEPGQSEPPRPAERSMPEAAARHCSRSCNSAAREARASSTAPLRAMSRSSGPTRSSFVTPDVLPRTAARIAELAAQHRLPDDRHDPRSSWRPAA